MEKEKTGQNTNSLILMWDKDAMYNNIKKQQRTSINLKTREKIGGDVNKLIMRQQIKRK